MWAFTKDGFFSVVKDRFCRPAQVVVRARFREDLEGFMRALSLRAEIMETTQADYRFRVIVFRDQWAQYVKTAAEQIDYPNFKGTVPIPDGDRHVAYMACWTALRRWQEEP